MEVYVVYAMQVFVLQWAAPFIAYTYLAGNCTIPGFTGRIIKMPPYLIFNYGWVTMIRTNPHVRYSQITILDWFFLYWYIILKKGLHTRFSMRDQSMYNLK